MKGTMGRAESFAIWMGIVGNAALFGGTIVIGRDNIKYLMGEVPPRALRDRILHAARSVDGVRALNDVFAHSVGTTVAIEVHINADRTLNIEAAHTIGKNVQRAIEGMEEISRAFIHIEPLIEAGGEKQ